MILTTEYVYATIVTEKLITMDSRAKQTLETLTGKKARRLDE